MITTEDLGPWIIEALKSHGGRAWIVQVCKHIWDAHETEINESGNLLYTWQYDVRWAAQQLRDNGVLNPRHGSTKRPWELG